MTLEGAQGRIWCSKLCWQTVPCSVCDNTVNFTVSHFTIVFTSIPPWHSLLWCHKSVWLRCAVFTRQMATRDVLVPEFLGPHPVRDRRFASAVMSPLPIILNLHLLKKLADMHSVRSRVRVSASLIGYVTFH